ncbi:hypothetical protein RJ639_033233 [Escallonia herrerae]|uniref:Integrase catalytic domain-containing protein n=1 Tax=Escallonia herrerae TaxID=1293975 RepID=A0AA88X2S3_9ASTE|nr:hypothetical protein RJ639_033233 [Escallonia herrerae]
MAVIHAMQQSIERLQATIENPPLRPEPPRAPGTSKTPEQTSHNQHAMQTNDEESNGERRHPRSRRHEENYSKAYSARNTYANTGGNRAERYSNAPIIIGRPFTEEIDLFLTPPYFKMPPCESYDGTGDPMDHLARFTSGMNLHLVPDQIMCRAFPITLKGAAHVWFQHLAPRSISCWAQLAESFRSNFLTSRVQRKNSSALFRIIQGLKESLNSYYARFNFKKLLIDHLDAGVTFAAMARGSREVSSGGRRFNVAHQEESHSGQKRRDHPEGKNQDEPKRPRAILPKPFTPLNTTREHILHQIKGQDILKWPKPMRGPAEKRDTQLYYHLHKDHDHTTEEYKVLQLEIENLIAKGYLKQFIKNNRPQNRGRNPPRRANEAPPKDPPVINTISGGPSAGGLSSSSQKAYARQIDAFQVKRILIDTGSLADILFEDAFLQMGISEDRVKPITSPMYGFTAVAESVVSAVLVWEEAARQLPIYYVSKILQRAEQRYPDTEKLAFALLMAARKLRPYFQSHTIVRFTSVAHPQTNGQTEVTNRTLLQGIKKKLDGVKGLWVDELPKILWAYNTTTRTPTGETPFSLSFGTEALAPVEIGLPSLRLMTYDLVQNVEALRANLDLLDERREQAAMRLTAYQHRVSKFYDQRVRPRMFKVGDLVLRRIEASAPWDGVGN